MMSWLKVLRETPKWVTIATAVVFAVMVYFEIFWNYSILSAGESIGTVANQYTTIWDNVSYPMPLAAQTSVIRIAGSVICVLLGFICLLLGIARSSNKLDGMASYLMAGFLALFTIHTFSSLDFAAEYIHRIPLFVIRWTTYFIYPFPFFLYIFYNLRPSFYKWTWPLFFLPVANSIAVWLAFLTLGLSFDITGLWHTLLSVSCFIILLTVGFFGTVQKSPLRYTRVISIIWLVWLVFVGIRTLLGYQFGLNNEVIINIIVSALVSVSYLVFDGTKEIFTYKTDMQMLETKNGLLLENYQSIESYIKQIAMMKHEMLNHLFAINILLENGEHERLAQYLNDIQGSYLAPAEPLFCGHRLIQSMLWHANQRARQISAETSIEVSALPPISITDADAVSLLMNLLNNALESCEKIQPPDKRWIEVVIKCRAPYLCISVKNALHNETRPVPRNSILATTKKDAAFHGYGISIVQDVAKKYNGFATFECSGDTFVAEAALCVVAE